MNPGINSRQLKGMLPGRTTTDEEELFCYGFDASSTEDRPSAVLKPVNTDEVSRAAAYADKYNIPIVPRGAGTGMTGGAVPLRDTVVMSLESMNRILEVDERDMVAVVEPGVINGCLQEVLESKGFFYPPDPASLKFCTLGGNVAENAGGPRAVKYGVTKDYVLGLEAVMPDGRVFMTGGRTYKGVVGYDLTSLLVGSEGTLAVVTKIFLRILPLPEETATLLCSFEEIGDAAQCVNGITAASIIPRTLEFMDSASIRAVENYRKFGLPDEAGAALLVEVDGTSETVIKEAEKIASVCRSLNGKVQIADDQYSRNRLWDARRAISPALYHLKPTKINEDIVVPRGKIPEMISALGGISEKFNLMIASFGHAGDGNIHVNVMTDREDEDEYRRAKESVRAIFEETLRLGGTISGEHGVGTTKRPYLKMELSDVSISLMKQIKAAFDPKGLLNPGKIFPE